MQKIHVSVVVPAHNEEKYVKRCIQSIKKAATYFKGNVEIIVVCNRCTDKTEEIAVENGARVVKTRIDVLPEYVMPGFGQQRGG